MNVPCVHFLGSNLPSFFKVKGVQIKKGNHFKVSWRNLAASTNPGMSRHPEAIHTFDSVGAIERKSPPDKLRR